MASPIPDNLKKVYMIGVCGSGMAAAALMLKEAGYEVSGSDDRAYPPMSVLLAESGVKIYSGYSAANLEESKPDLVIVGNAIRLANPEFAALARTTTPFVSMADALYRLFMSGRRRLAVCGTHGKTTTASMAAHMLEACGVSPGFFIGGIPLNFNLNGALGKSGSPFVIEGDEYDTALFDKRPKMLVYRPNAAVVTSMEFDHADIYPSFAAYKIQFEQLARSLGKEGSLILCADRTELFPLAELCAGEVLFYGVKERAADGASPALAAFDVREDGCMTRFKAVEADGTEREAAMPLFGLHNVENALAAALTASKAGVKIGDALAALETFKGVKRRQEIVASVAGVDVIDDFAHHPTAAEETILSVRRRFPGRRIIAAFDPRSNTSRRKIYEDKFAEALCLADAVFISSPEDMWKIPEGDRMDAQRLADKINGAGGKSAACADADEIAAEISALCKPGDVVLGMSNGGFGGFYAKIKSALEKKAETW